MGANAAKGDEVAIVPLIGVNLNVHVHTLALDGVYEITRDGPSHFHPLAPPDDEEVAHVVAASDDEHVAHALGEVAPLGARFLEDRVDVAFLTRRRIGPLPVRGLLIARLVLLRLALLRTGLLLLLLLLLRSAGSRPFSAPPPSRGDREMTSAQAPRRRSSCSISRT